jgi:3-deoxy-manno-octulosonate cytidylyltransferase (CMP-KDO synthetase)
MTTPSHKVVVVIPARYASSRLPGKPLAEINGKPMIQHVVERARRATLVHEVIVATDDQRIADAVRGFGCTAVMTPVDCQSGSDRIAIVARDLPTAEIIVNVQGDEPVIPPAMIDEAVEPLLKDPALPVGTLVTRLQTTEELLDPNTVKVVIDKNGRCLYFSRSPIPFGRDCSPAELVNRYTVYRHIGMYVYRRTFLMHYATLTPTALEQAEKLEQLRILEHGYAIHAAVTTHKSIAVDTPADLERVRGLLHESS